MYFPSATYRIQLNSSYTFSHLKKIIDYLHKLGISTIYAAPITTAMKGSTHGYDVCNPDELNPEIGSLSDLTELAEILSEKGMGWLQDIVPNHMAFITGNERLMDVLERGPQSPYYHYFDINWNHFDSTYKGKLMVPFIGKNLDEAIDENEIALLFDDNGFHIAYFNTLYPVAVDSILYFFSFLTDNKRDATNKLLTQLKADKEHWKEAKKQWLHQIKKDEINIQNEVTKINGNKALLRQLLNKQYYVLTCYKVTDSEINFRRFFTVNQLICLRMEDEFVFTDYHQFIFHLYQKRFIQGVRIDHIDGLYHPQQYIERVQKLFGDDCYIIAEKILAYNEDIARDWHMQSTSGYEFLSFVNQLLTDKTGAGKLLSFYNELVPQSSSYDDLVFNKKHSFLLTHMGGELQNLCFLIDTLKLFDTENLDVANLKNAVGILMSSFPVYRIYPDRYPLQGEALKIIDETFAKAETKIGAAQHELELLKTVFYATGKQPQDANKLLFLMRLMQFTGPLAAKGVEDTTFYIYNPLISHNQVGDSPSQLGISVDEFHAKMMSRQKNNPYSLNATSTHDTKRGEDGRMRINALAAMPEEWIKNVNNWRQMNTPFITIVNNKPAPSTNDEYFIYQSLIGAFPEDLQVTDVYKQRTFSFLEKALREAKVETTYDNPNADYENACKQFFASLLDEQHSFLQSFIPFLETVIDVATLYSLAQTVIKITAPGIPDVYQGCELWDLSYVDPDNRQPIDFECRKNNLDEIIELEKNGADAVLSFIHQHKKEGRQKLYATYKTLNLRKTNNDLFLQGDYLPLQTNGEKIIAYARRKAQHWIVVIIPLSVDFLNNDEEIFISLPQDAPTEWKNIFTGEIITISSALNLTISLQKFPVAVLTGGL